MTYFADRNLATRLELAHALGMAELAHTLRELNLAPARVLPVTGGYAVITGANLPVNRATGLGLPAAVTTQELDSVEDFFGEAGLPPSIDLCPLADFTLLQLLNQRDYRIAKFFNILYRTLEELNLDPILPEDIALVRVTETEKPDWIKTVAWAFSGKEDQPDEISTIMATASAAQPSTTCFLALVNGEPAGGGAVVVRDGTAGFFSTAILPKFRERGLQKALIQARLALAAQAGCDLATVMTHPGSNSQRNLERQGFKVAYTKINLVKER